MAIKEDENRLGETLEDLFSVLMERKRNMQDQSYVALLYKKGDDSILKKIGEEAAEVIIAAKGGDKKKIVHEVTDLFFHCLVLMGHKEISPEEIAKEFKRRMGTSGIAEKAQRKKI
ncbi:MAG: phosphoribosyl-ATP diphosphatase [Deltaproteobacteria bacterium]|nr:phosphoribosyl-ATP diphosphatase [Deltaproteobacteria bacterium]